MKHPAEHCCTLSVGHVSPVPYAPLSTSSLRVSASVTCRRSLGFRCCPELTEKWPVCICCPFIQAHSIRAEAAGIKGPEPRRLTVLSLTAHSSPWAPAPAGERDTTYQEVTAAQLPVGSQVGSPVLWLPSWGIQSRWFPGPLLSSNFYAPSKRLSPLSLFQPRLDLLLSCGTPCWIISLGFFIFCFVWHVIHTQSLSFNSSVGPSASSGVIHPSKTCVVFLVITAVVSFQGPVKDVPVARGSSCQRRVHQVAAHRGLYQDAGKGGAGNVVSLGKVSFPSRREHGHF